MLKFIVEFLRLCRFGIFLWNLNLASIFLATFEFVKLVVLLFAVAIGTAPVPELLFSMGTVIYRACVFPKIQSSEFF